MPSRTSASVSATLRKAAASSRRRAESSAARSSSEGGEGNPPQSEGRRAETVRTIVCGAGRDSAVPPGGVLRHCFQKVKVTGGMVLSGRTGGTLFAARKAAGVASILGWVLVLSAGPALAIRIRLPAIQGLSRRTRAATAAGPGARPGLPPAPDPLVAPVVAGPAAGQDPTPFTGAAPFGPASFVPANSSTVGVAQPIIINFPGPVDDFRRCRKRRPRLFGSAGSRQVLLDDPHSAALAPADFWPARTAVSVDAGGAVSSFHTGDTLVATADDATTK